MTQDAAKKVKKGKVTDANMGSVAQGLNLASLAQAVNAWREYYNPLHGLTIQRAIYLFQASQRGLNADLHWTYNFIEQSHPALMALIERRTSALLELDHNFKSIPADNLPKGASKSLADEQAACLRECYDRIDNLTDAIEFLEIVAFRGYGHLEKIYNGETEESACITHLEPVEQWHWCRKSVYAPWQYVANAMQTNYGEEVDINRFIVHEVKRPINRIALLSFIRNNLSNKDWDGFIEIYGIPHWLITMPAGIPKEKEAEYRKAAEIIAKGGSGALPNGSDAKCADAPRGTNPFRDRLEFLDEQLILAGTGGLLTMLSMPGSGTLAGSAHMESFAKIAKARAKKISEVLQRQLDAEILERNFPGQPRLAYFELAANEETDVGTVVSHAKDLAQVGYKMKREFLEEKTGYEFEEQAETSPAPAAPKPGEEPAPMPGDNMDEVGNRRRVFVNRQFAQIVDSAETAYGRAQARALQPITDRLQAILKLTDFDAQKAALTKLDAELPELLKQINLDPESAKVLLKAMSESLQQGLKGKKP